jgi:hypothetical protein
VQGAQKALPTTDNSASGGFVSILFRWRHWKYQTYIGR